MTGASRGIGRSIAWGLVQGGYEVTLSARDGDALENLAVQLRSAGGEAHVAVADLGEEVQVESLANQQLRRNEYLDVLVLAGGVGTAGPLAEYPLERLDRQVAVNLRAPFQLVQRLLPALRAAAGAPTEPGRGANVIAIASLAGVVSEPRLAAYGATKAALISLCESIIVSEGAEGVSGTAISPGYVDTDMSGWVRDRIDPAEMIRAEDIAEIAIAVTRLLPHVNTSGKASSLPQLSSSASLDRSRRG